MSETSDAATTKNIFDKLQEADLTNYCRVCRQKGSDDKQLKFRPLFNGNRLTRIIANTIHLEVKDMPGLPRFLCEKCLDLLKTFSMFQVEFRRSEEAFRMFIEGRKQLPMETLIEFSNSIEHEKHKESEQQSAALVNNFLTKAKKNRKSKSKLEN
ncbi:uncharacterized protein LOC108596955 [Drosophila busckii]|uniref:uncharacterized protein LOC108596955 n=1 Tax=Drosophila busckii TaxID=30019 RepID=UPI00083F00F4|nr:uncharacterized protein LOC108596955 [Drosophila busckii]